jgi:hypothetical protein
MPTRKAAAHVGNLAGEIRAEGQPIMVVRE